jgi:hypothetical protein
MEELIKNLKNVDKPAIIAVSGFGGSGKSTIAKKIGLELNASVIGVDSFQLEGAFSKQFNFWNIMDYSRLENEILIPFSQNQKVIRYGHYNVPTNKVDQIFEIQNNGIIIIEGVGLFRPELLKYFQYKVWIDLPIEDAINRGKYRDRYEYGNPADELWDTVWKDNDLECFELFKPKENADFIIDNSKNN